MKNILNNLISSYNSQKNSDLYMEWVASNSTYYKRYFTIIALAITSLLIPFDFLLYEDPTMYLNTRVFLMILYILQLLIIFKFQSNRSFFHLSILLPSLSYNIAYTYFLINADIGSSYYMMLLLATFFVVIISNLFIYKFYREQYALLFISIACLFIASILNPLISSDIVKLIVFHLFSLCVSIYYRFQFMSMIVNKYEHFSSLLPNKYAKLLSISDDSVDVSNIFPTKEYFSVCLCSDWRGFQEISTSNQREKVENMLEKFYTIVYDHLDKANLNGQYYANWTADELFIIFYGNDDEADKVMEEALLFAHSLATSIYMSITANVDRELSYDIGLAAGHGLIGLQGPKKYKKTTITGDVAGNSKRFETQAKEIRKNTSSKPFPIIVMDQNLFDKTKGLSVYNNLSHKEIICDVKDIEGVSASMVTFDNT